MSDPDASHPDNAAQEHRGLKAVVIVLGVLLILGFIALIGGVFYQITKEDPEGDAPVSASLANKGVGGDIMLSLPQGASIIQVDLDGGRAAVLVQLAGDSGGPGPREIVIVDLASGRVITRLRAED